MDATYLASISDPATYLGWGWLSVSVPNLVVILVMIVLFVLAIVAAVPEGTGRVMTTTDPAHRRRHRTAPTVADTGPFRHVDRWAAPGVDVEASPRTSCCRTVSPPMWRPGSTSSGWLTLAAFLVILASGLVLAFAGPAWYHTSSLGLFTNSLHFWSVQLFFVFMVVHLWGKFWMAAWRGRRAMTWITGVVAFLASIGTAFTGYLVQTNFDSQWISFEAKDGLNAVGIGAFFNVANLGQMLLLHACLLPLVVGRDRGVARAAGPAARRRPADRRRRDTEVSDRAGRGRHRHGGAAMSTARPQTSRERDDVAGREWNGPVASLRHRQGRRHRDRRGQHPDGPAGRPVQLARRAAADLPGLGDQRAGQLLRHRRPGTGRHQRVRELRAAVQHRGGRGRRRTAGAAAMVRRHPSRSTPRTTSSSRPCVPSPSPPTSPARWRAWDAASAEQQTAWATDYDTALTAAGRRPTAVAAATTDRCRCWPRG